MKKLVLASLLLSTSTFASDLSGKFGLGLNLDYPVPSFGNKFNDNVDAKYGVGVHGKYHFNSNWGLEVGLGQRKYKDTSVRDESLRTLALYRLSGADDFTFVVGAGLGFSRLKNYVPSSTKLDILARGGVEYNLTSSLVLGAHVDYQYVSKILGDMPGSRMHVLAPGLSLTWYFGAAEVTRAVKEKVQEVKEAVKEQLAKKSDTDGDGDGVYDEDDKCPQTAKGSKVNDFGCAVEEKAEIKINVEFASGKSTVADQYKDHLNDVANFLKKYSTVKVVVEGHTDSQGSVELNTKLSQKRADAVMNTLVSLGVEKSRLSAKGYGPKMPIADNATEDGRQKNRRVIAVIKE